MQRTGCSSQGVDSRKRRNHASKERHQREKVSQARKESGWCQVSERNKATTWWDRPVEPTTATSLTFRSAQSKPSTLVVIACNARRNSLLVPEVEPSDGSRRLSGLPLPFGIGAAPFSPAVIRRVTEGARLAFASNCTVTHSCAHGDGVLRVVADSHRPRQTRHHC